MSKIICQQKAPKVVLSPLHKTFNRLKKKVETLQSELKTLHKECEAGLLFYQTEIQPQKKQLAHGIREFVKLIYVHYKQPKSFSKKERNILKQLMIDGITKSLNMTTFEEPDADITAIFKELTGKSCQAAALDELNALKQHLQEMFELDGVNLDLSKIDLNDNEQEVTQKIFKALKDSVEANIEEEIPLKSKSKKELQKELKAKELESLQKKGLGTIYKQLAKAFHPDLEQDLEQKVEKEALMKRLTSAYEDNDLHTLLSLEIEWMNRSEEEAKNQTDEQIKIYNSILKDQVETLQENMQMVILNPKYLPLQSYLHNRDYGLIPLLTMVSVDLKMEVKEVEALIKSLSHKNAEEVVRDFLKYHPR